MAAVRRGRRCGGPDLDAALGVREPRRASRGSRRGVRTVVYALVSRLRRDLAGSVPAAWTPHWLRHSHATALLLAGVPVHVVRRRLGHADVQTTLETLRACDRGSRDARGGRVACAGRAMADRGCRRADRAMLMTRHLNSAGSGRGRTRRAGRAVGTGPRRAAVTAAVARHRPGGVPLGLPALRRWHSQQPRPDARRSHRASRRARKEITWCMFRIADLGGVIGMSGAATVVRMLGAAVAAGQRPGGLIAGLASGRGRAGMVPADPGRLLPGQRTVPLTGHDALRRM